MIFTTTQGKDISLSVKDIESILTFSPDISYPFMLDEIAYRFAESKFKTVETSEETLFVLNLLNQLTQRNILCYVNYTDRENAKPSFSNIVLIPKNGGGTERENILARVFSTVLELGNDQPKMVKTLHEGLSLGEVEIFNYPDVGDYHKGRILKSTHPVAFFEQYKRFLSIAQ